MKNAIVCVTLAASTLLSGCLVSKKKFDEQVALADKYLAERNDCNDKLNSANATIEDLNKQIAALKAEVEKLKDSNASLEDKNRRLNQLKNESDALCEKVKQQLDALANASSAEKDKLMKQLAEKEKELLNKAEELNKLSAELNKLSADLNERDAKVRELENLIARKDSAVQALKKKMLDALKGFNASELSVYEKDGKVYVQLSDKLLFATGSYVVEPKGKDALKKISEVLQKQPDISIMVEGHTDNKPYMSNTTGPINSNWDLSVMRASSVTKLMTSEYKLEAARVTPAGRGEFFPVETNETPEGRSKNRRIEIVLTPDIKGIMDILNGSN